MTTAEMQDQQQRDIAGMVDYLENILMRHLERLRRYDMDGALALAEESHQLAMAIAKTGVLNEAQYAEQRGRIRQLYSDISLTIAVERQEVSEKLKAIRKGLKALGVYTDR